MIHWGDSFYFERVENRSHLRYRLCKTKGNASPVLHLTNIFRTCGISRISTPLVEKSPAEERTVRNWHSLKQILLASAPRFESNPPAFPFCEADKSGNYIHLQEPRLVSGIWLTSAVLVLTSILKWETIPACRVQQHAGSLCEYKDFFWVLIKGILSTSLCFHSFLKLPA
jgi:hypothetical protein